MEFYSFSFGDMKVAQADQDSPKLVAVDVTIGFKADDTHTVQAVEARVTIPHQADLTLDGMQQAAFERVHSLLCAAAEQCSERTHAELAAASETQLIRTASSPD
ncbi:hypothetical protein [Salinarimonas soli]|uniref:Uncharacterized protein n=1 Tax=Salinarimonas soli TaxID=1638099 RepID=A0A5B2V7J3_9HYPH|nr:hypothetical protein [Salinarimonas soli]KAA2234758.1 hypothetical protein F0L46_23095 [Salinarimonas soli]